MTSTTWAAWVRLDADSSYGTAISAAFDGAGAGHTLGFHTGENVRKPRVLWNHANGHISIMSEEPVELGEWNHMAVTYDADSEEIVLYVNGEAKADGTVGTTTFSIVNLGRRASSKNCPLNGALDDVSIFDRALSGDEIGQLFDGEEIAFSGLVLSWGFAEGEGFACADSSGNGNDGSLVGYPAGEVSNWVEGKIGGALSLPQASEHLEITGLQMLHQRHGLPGFAWTRKPVTRQPLQLLLMARERATLLVFTREIISEILGFCGIMQMDTHRSCRQIRLSSGSGTIWLSPMMQIPKQSFST